MVFDGRSGESFLPGAWICVRGWKASMAPKLISFFSASFEGGLFPHCTCHGDNPLEFPSLNVPPPPGEIARGTVVEV